jgi:hypothetical protein
LRPDQSKTFKTGTFTYTLSRFVRCKLFCNNNISEYLGDLKSEFIRDFDYSYDGKQLAIIRGHRESDVVLIRDSEK